MVIPLQATPILLKAPVQLPLIPSLLEILPDLSGIKKLSIWPLLSTFLPGKLLASQYLPSTQQNL